MYKKDFHIAPDRTWLNCAHQGPMPNCAIQALQKAGRLKQVPSLLTEDLFFDVPQKLKKLLGEMFGADAGDIILGDSATYTLHLLVAGLKWQIGDEVIVVDGDFPANIFPWMALKQQGVGLRMIKLKEAWLRVKDLEEAVNKKTRVVCVSWVNSFTGHSLNAGEIGAFCRAHNVMFVLNGSQAFGYKPFNVKTGFADVVFACGHKWLLGPYGTGFGWMNNETKEQLQVNRYCWLNQYAGSFEHLSDYRLQVKENYLDMFNTANFFNYIPWIASLDYIHRTGIETIEKYNKKLVNYFLQWIDEMAFQVLSPLREDLLSSIIVIHCCENKNNAEIYSELIAEGIYCSLREGNLRISPHFYNTIEQIEKLLDVLDKSR